MKRRTLLAGALAGPAAAKLELPPVSRGYCIPLIDLSAEIGRQVVVDREPGQYLGHPSTLLLDDLRTILAVYPKGHGRGAIVLKRSEDGGLTWGPRIAVPPSWASSLETPTLYRARLRSGRTRLLLFSGLYPIRQAVSDDDGRTWSELRPIGDWGGIVAMASCIQRSSGELVAFFHDDGRFFANSGRAGGVMTLYQTESTDGGDQWSPPRPLFGAEEIHLCEPGLVRSPDGEEWALLLRENRRRRNSHAIFSSDQGKNWSRPRELPGALTGDRHTAVQAPDGRLFISFRDTTLESPTRGDWVAWVGRYSDIRAGREGEYRVRLMRNRNGSDCGYPGVELLPDGTIVATSYGHWMPGEPPYIVSVRLKLGELDERA